MKLRSEYGNVIIETKDERKILRLKSLGYTEIKAKKTKSEVNPSTKGRSNKNGNKKEA